MFALAEESKDLMLITADLGYGVFEEFEKKYPKQYLNVGVAEQNMIGVASGLALEGKTVYLYSIGNFPTLRCLEQIRNDACYHELNINIVAMGGGFSYGGLGMSHHATEDIAIMRALPGVTVVVPSTEWEAEEATLALSKNKGVGYLRLDKSKATIEETGRAFSLGESNMLLNGDDYAVIVAGGIAEEAIDAAYALSEYFLSLKVLSMHTVKPIDKEAIADLVKYYKGIICIEEGTKLGGLGSAVSEVIMETQNYPKNFRSIGINDQYICIVGSQKFLREESEMTADFIVKVILEWESLT